MKKMWLLQSRKTLLPPAKAQPWAWGMKLQGVKGEDGSQAQNLKHCVKHQGSSSGRHSSLSSNCTVSRWGPCCNLRACWKIRGYPCATHNGIKCWAWGGPSVIKKAVSCTVVRFSSQHPLYSLPQYITPVPGDLTLFSISKGARHSHSAQICVQSKHSCA